MIYGHKPRDRDLHRKSKTEADIKTERITQTQIKTIGAIDRPKHKDRDGQSYRQRDRQTDRHRGRHRDSQRDRQRQTKRQIMDRNRETETLTEKARQRQIERQTEAD